MAYSASYTTTATTTYQFDGDEAVKIDNRWYRIAALEVISTTYSSESDLRPTVTTESRIFGQLLKKDGVTPDARSAVGWYEMTDEQFESVIAQIGAGA